MNKLLVLLIFVVFGLAACKSNKQPTLENKKITDVKAAFENSNDFLRQYEVPSQTFKVPANDPTQVRGKQGTIISIDPADLVTENGQSLGRNIEIELKELTSKEQLLKGNVQTTSNGQLLVSGGAYYINITSEGQQLKLKKGKSLLIEFPKISSSEMFLFYGQRDSLGQMNWQQAQQKFESRARQKIASISADTSIGDLDAIVKYLDSESKRPLTPEEKKQLEEQKKINLVSEKIYKALEINQFGWINCDRFYDIPKKTDLSFTFDDKDSVISANVYLVFRDINSLMQSNYFSFADKEYNTGFKNVPIGAKTRLIAFSLRNGKAYTYRSDLTIESNKTVQMTMKETDKDEISKLFY